MMDKETEKSTPPFRRLVEKKGSFKIFIRDLDNLRFI